MKLATLIMTSILAMSGNVQADPVVDAECAAIFKGVAINLAKVSPNSAAKSQNISSRLKSKSDVTIGTSTATRYYVMKMDDMTADLRANGGTGISENEMTYCVGVAKSYGMM